MNPPQSPHLAHPLLFSPVHTYHSPMAAKKARETEYEILRRGAGFHGHVVGPIPDHVTGAASGVRYLAQLAAEWGHLSGTRTREADISSKDMDVHVYDEWNAINRLAFVPTLKLLRKKLAKTTYAQFSKGVVEEIVSNSFHEAFDDGYRARAKPRRRR